MTVYGLDHIGGKGARMRMSVSRGFNLVEVMVALLVVAVGFTALLASTSVGLHSAQKTNAALTSYVAARNFVEALQNHYRFSLDAIVLDDVNDAMFGAGTSWGTAYTIYYLPPPPNPHDETVLKTEGLIKHSGISTGETRFKQLYGLSAGGLARKRLDGLFTSLLGATPSVSGMDFVCEVGALPPSSRYRLGDASDWSTANRKPYPWGPYQLMVDFYEHAQTYDVSSAVPFRMYKVKVWVFPGDFPRKTGASDYNPTTQTGVDNRNREILGVYEFDVRLGKAIAPFE